MSPTRHQARRRHGYTDDCGSRATKRPKTTIRSDNPYTRGIADFVAGLTYESVPCEVLTRIKLLILDSIGCAFYAANLDSIRILQKTLCGIDTSKACSVWGSEVRLSAPHSSLVNGAQVQGF